MNETYLDTARLLTHVAPLVFADDTFALKGGTAINLFVATCRACRWTSIWSFLTTRCHATKRWRASTRLCGRQTLVYLATSNRPVHEVLFPPLRDIRHDYEFNFQGMTAEPVLLDPLFAARERLVREIQQGLDEEERRFPLSLVAEARPAMRSSCGPWRTLMIPSPTTWPNGSAPMPGTPLAFDTIEINDRLAEIKV
jgi:hypothetical protein